MDLNKLKTFCVVAESESITKAASNLYRTQSAISQQIQQLEEEIHLALLERTGSRVYLTKEGETLYRYADELIKQIEEEVERLKSEATSSSGTIKIAVIEEIHKYFLADLINAFNAEYPQITFEIVSTPINKIEEELLNNRVDFGFMVIYNDKKLFEAYPYFCFPMICVASRDYLNNAPIESFQDLISCQFIGFHKDLRCLKFWLNKNNPEAAKRMKSKIASITMKCPEGQKNLLLQGRGIGMVHKLMVKEELNNGSLVEILPQKSAPVFVTIDIVRKKKHTDKLIHKTFLDFALKFTEKCGTNNF
ncbi:MAG: LysR family transcriptional regulator [Candidatus Caenarcaniphilales bacterium]|nr:LysR family transcriptional regulator [Candidatus Caenarcaniphilales bacterium]